MKEIVYLNGSLVSQSEAKVPAFDYGFLYGYGLFETMRAYSGYVFRLGPHLDRLFSSARTLGINLQSTSNDLENALYDILQANSLTDARLRLTISGGEGDASPDLSGSKGPTVLVTARSYHSPSPQKAFTAAVSAIRRNSCSPLSRVKSLNYLDNLLARREARTAGADEAILLNEKGFLAEASVCNVFLVSHGALITPDKDSGILPGITRQVIMELGLDRGIEVRETNVSLEELWQADEAFLTNSMIEIAPLVRIDDRTIGSGMAGEVTQALAQTYTQLVHAECELT